MRFKIGTVKRCWCAFLVKTFSLRENGIGHLSNEPAGLGDGGSRLESQLKDGLHQLRSDLCRAEADSGATLRQELATLQTTLRRTLSNGTVGAVLARGRRIFP